MARRKTARDVVEDELMDTTEVAALLGMSPGSVANWRSRGLGPRFIKVGTLVRYRRSEINEWVEEQQRKCAC